MSSLDAETSTPSAAPTPTPENHAPAAEPLANGTPSPTAEGNGRSPAPAALQAAPSGPPAEETGASASGPSVAERGEEAVDTVAQKVGFFAAWGTRQLASLASRTREVVQDFWAEVQDFRQGKKP